METANADTDPVRSSVVYFCTAYGLGTGLSLAIGLTGGHQSRFIGLGYLSMLIPTVSVGITAAVTREPTGATGWNRFPSRYLPLALFLMPAVLHAVMLPLAVSLSGLHFQPWLSPQSDGLYHAPSSRGWGVMTSAGLAAHIVVNAVAGLMVVSALALFEEVGWRAWLLPRLSFRVGPRPAVVLSSIMWAVWHVPFVISGILHVDGLSPSALAIIEPIGVFGSGLILGWLWLRSESVWIVAVAHGALNNWGQYAFKFTDTAILNQDGLVLGAGSIALVVAGSFLLICSVRRSLSIS